MFLCLNIQCVGLWVVGNKFLHPGPHGDLWLGQNPAVFVRLEFPGWWAFSSVWDSAVVSLWKEPAVYRWCSAFLHMCDVLLNWKFWLWVPAGVRMRVHVPLVFPLNTNKCKWKKTFCGCMSVSMFTVITFDLFNVGAFRTCRTLSLYCKQTHVILLHFSVPPHNFCQPLV